MAERVTEETMARLRKLLAKVTPLPWFFEYEGSRTVAGERASEDADHQDETRLWLEARLEALDDAEAARPREGRTDVD